MISVKIQCYTCSYELRFLLSNHNHSKFVVSIAINTTNDTLLHFNDIYQDRLAIIFKMKIIK